jgi:hypothetical protein
VAAEASQQVEKWFLTPLLPPNFSEKWAKKKVPDTFLAKI